ncbi:hypothetical protein BGZ63DRAFT_337250, partial [Mariannaea sp. PMI_226]
MGQSQSITAEIEIQASPERVRSVFMDFARYSEWSQWSFELADSGKTPSELKAGDQLKVSLKGMKFSPSVVKNSPESFQWLGSLPLVFVGQHQFNFTPSQKHPGGTTFTQREDFSGALAFLMKPGSSGSESTLANWNGFNAELKKEAEKSSS